MRIHERFHLEHGHGGIVAAHMLAVNFAERGEVGEIGGAIGDVHDHPPDVLRRAAGRAHDLHHAGQRAVPLRHEVADRHDLTRHEQDPAALVGQHAVIPAAGASAERGGIDDLERHGSP